MTALEPSFSHVLALTDRHGTFEHAEFATPRPSHGYCVDDVARVLVVATRQPDPGIRVRGLAEGAVRFIGEAQGPSGACRNRKDARGRWHGRRSVEDCWGRSLWGLGTAAVQGQGWVAQSARKLFEHGTGQRSPWPRAMAFAALGAAEVAGADPRHGQALALLDDAAAMISGLRSDAPWRWPEARLSYANAVLPDVLLAAGAALGRPAMVADGLELLTWLLDRETVDGRLSVTPVGGAGPGDPIGRFDQQPIEVATMADACARAAGLDGSPRWPEAIAMAEAWFDGDNDSHTLMWDPRTGGGYDGLHADGANHNQGAESTLALVSVRQQARRLALVAA
jgi:hypothetical protein